MYSLQTALYYEASVTENTQLLFGCPDHLPYCSLFLTFVIYTCFKQSLLPYSKNYY